MKPNFRQTSFNLKTDYKSVYEHRSIFCLIDLIKRGLLKISLDIETTPKYPYTEALDPWYGDIRLIGIYAGKSAGFFYCDCFLEKKEIIKEFFKCLYEYQVEVIVHHAWFEGIWIYYHYGVILNYRCTLVFHRVATAGRRLNADLNSVCKFYNVQSELFDDDFSKKEMQMGSFGGLISLEKIDYVLSDAKKAWDIFEEALKKFPWPYSSYLFECRNLPIFIEMGVNGLPVDETLANQILVNIELKLKEIERSLGFNPGSRLALQRMFTNLGFIPRESEVFDFQSTPEMREYESIWGEKENILDFSSLDDLDKKFLGVELFAEKKEEIEQQFDDTVLLIAETKFPKLAQWRKIRAYRRIQWNEGYIKSVLKRVHNGRVKPKILPIAQSGYRVSVNNPNLANSIKDSDLLREYGILPGRIIFAEKKMLSTDGPAAHLRALTQFSKDPVMRNAINKGDFHSQTASAICKFLNKPWDFAYISKAKDDKTDPFHFEIKQIRAGAKEFIYLWLNGGQAEKAVVTLATGSAKYRFSNTEEAKGWITGINNTYVCAAALKSLLSDGPIKNKNKRDKLLKTAFGISANEYAKHLSIVVDDNHVLNALGKYSHLEYLPHNARIIAAWMSGERVWILSCAQRVYEIRKQIGYEFSSWQHDEFIGRSISDIPYETANAIEDICLDVSRSLMGFTNYYKDGDPNNPAGKDKKGRYIGDFSAIKMQIANLTEK